MVSTQPAAAVWATDAYPPHRAYERTTRLGVGDDAWQNAVHNVLRWGVKTRSGFKVDDDGIVVPGRRVTVTARVLGLSVREPVQVVDVVQEATRVGFSYRTLPGHPVSGEEAFIVHRDGDIVLLTIRSLTAPAPDGAWRAAYPLLRLGQVIVRGRYRRALILR